MKRRLLVTTAWAITGLLPELVASTALADDVRYYQEAGTTYRETHSVVHRPVTEMTMQPTTRTYYRDQTTTQLQDAYHTYYVPVTEYRRESYWQGRWNPFTQPTLAERWVTSTRWEMRVDRVQIPVAQRTLVPETRTEHVPVVTHSTLSTTTSSAACRWVVPIRRSRPPRSPAGKRPWDKAWAEFRGSIRPRAVAQMPYPAARMCRARPIGGRHNRQSCIIGEQTGIRERSDRLRRIDPWGAERCLRLGFVEIHSLVNVSKTSGDS